MNNEAQKAVYAVNIKKYRGKRTQQEYAEFLFVTTRCIQNWESRGCGTTTFALLQTINILEEEIQKLKEIINDENMTFQL